MFTHLFLAPRYALCMEKKDGVEGSKRWERFKDVCKQAYLIIRSRATFFINLLNMMLSCGIPELQVCVCV